MKFSYLLVYIFFINSVSCLTCDQVLAMSEDTKITMNDIITMQPKSIVQCIAHLGKSQLSSDVTLFIWQSIVKFYEGISNIPDKHLMLLRWITPAIQPDDYMNITLNNIDLIENFGWNYNLSVDQMSAILENVRENFASKEPEDFTSYDLIALKHILCAFNRSEIERIHPAAYREAASTIGRLENCNSDVMQGFALLAVQRSAFGHPATWNKAIVDAVGKVAKYLPPNLVKTSILANTTQTNTMTDSKMTTLPNIF